MIDFICPPTLRELGLRLEPERDADLLYLSTYFIAEHWPMVELMPWDDMQKKCLLAQQFEFQHKGYMTSYPDGMPLVIKKDETPIGRLFLAELPSSLHVVDILLAQNWRNHGIGTALMLAVQNAARGCRLPVTLSVDKQNSYADFYRRLGFIVSDSDEVLWQLRWPAIDPDLSETTDAHHGFRPLSRYARAGKAKAPHHLHPEFENDSEPDVPDREFLQARR